MAQTSWWAYIFLTVTVSLFCAATQSLGINQDDWVDPDDIMNYDRASKSMIKPGDQKLCSNEWVDPSQPECPLTCCVIERIEATDFQKKLATCEEVLVALESQKTCPETDPVATPLPNTQCNPVKAVETVYMKRFINILLRVSGLTGTVMKTGQDTLVKSLLMAVKGDQLTVLQRFGEDEKMTLKDLDEVLIDVLQSTESSFQLPVPVEWTENIKYFFQSDEILLRLTPWAIVLVPILMMLFARRFSEIFLAFFCLTVLFGFQWKYNYLVKMSEVDQMMATQGPAPIECRPDLMSWTQSFFHAVAGDAEICRQYHAAHHLPAALEVTPTVVLAHMISDFIATPMGAFGRGIGQLAHGIMDGFSYVTGWFLLTLVLSLFAVAVVAMFALLGGGSAGNWLFSVSGWRQLPQLPQPRRRESVQAVSDVFAATSQPALNSPNVVLHFHHAVRDVSEGAVQQLVASTRPQDEAMRIIGERIGGEARMPGGQCPATEREIFETINAGGKQTKSIPGNREEQVSPRSQAEGTKRKQENGSGDGVGNSSFSPREGMQSWETRSVRKFNVKKRVGKEDLKAASNQEAAILREIHSMLGDALKLDASGSDIEVTPTKGRETGESSPDVSARRELRTRGKAKTRRAVSEESESRSEAETASSPATAAEWRQFVEEVRLNSSASPKDGAGDRRRDFLSRVVDVLGDESFAPDSEGRDSSALRSEFMTSIQKILSDEEDAGEDGD